jgi:TfoX/Sxy family transcriptional regulator of competence genes
MNPTKVKKNILAEKLDLYDKLLKTNPDIQRKGDTTPYTSLNGHMFSYISKSGSLALRLPKDEREKFLKKYGTTLHEAYGVVQKEYVTVPDALFEKTEELRNYLEISYEYVRILKPKPTKKKKK